MLFRDMSCSELGRRVAIGLNDWMSLATRRSLVSCGRSVKEMERSISGFKPYQRECEAVLEWLGDPMNSILFHGEDSYPSFEGLERHLPFFLLFRGPVPRRDVPCVGVVGTRRADYDGLHKAFEIGLGAAVCDTCVASGLAEGVDQAAMRGCLAAKGVCIGVIACGHDLEYPALTTRLRESIVDCGGCIVSRFPPGTPAYKGNFVSRNMVIAAYSQRLVVVQAPERSGSLITCDYALSMGKDVLVSSEGLVQKGRSAPCRAGSQALVDDGAPVVASFSDMADNLDAPVVKRVGSLSSMAHGYAFDDGCMFRFGDQVYCVERGGGRRFVVENPLG